MKKYFTTHEVAQMCQVSRGSVIRWIHEGKILTATTIGGHNRISLEDVQKLLKELRLPVLTDFSGRPVQDFLKILIVDDEKAFCTMLEKYFETIFPGSKIEKASDGFEAGIKVESLKPDFVILDLMLPGIDGFRVCELIRGRETARKIKIIAITGYDGQVYREKILSLGADDFLAKPFALETLREILLRHGEFLPAVEKKRKVL